MKKIKVSFGILFIVIIISILAPLLSPFNPAEVNLSKVSTPPNSINLLGTDTMGRDILSRILYGGRVTLSVSIFSGFLSTISGLIYGSISGYIGGNVDKVMMRLLEALIAVPSLIILLSLQSIMRGGVLSMILIIGFTSWMPTARVIRSSFLELKERDFVKAARVLGTSHIGIILRHLLLNSLPSLILMFTLSCASGIFSEVTLSFLGIGVPQSIPSWGNMLTNAQNTVLTGAWWIPLFPGIMIVLTIISINLIGDN